MGDFGKIKASPYIDIGALGENIYESKSKLSVLNLNIQSINAKFDEFKIALDQLNSKQPINIICIQETWVVYYIKTLQPIPVCSNSQTIS